MTNDVVINNIINELCQKFNVAATELVPRMQAYQMAMSKLRMWISGAFMALFLVGLIAYICYLKYKRDHMEFVCSDEYEFAGFIYLLVNIIPIVVLIADAVNYVGWKYAPEIKAMEYIVNMFKK